MPLRLRPDIATTDTEDGVVLLDEHTGRYWQLNPTGAAILHALRQGEDPDQIAHTLASRYRISVEQARQDITALTEHLHTAKLVAS